MKLKNKKTGEIIETVIVDHGAEWEIRNMYTDEGTQTYDSLAELNSEWEDYEEPKTFFTIYYDGTISEFKDGDDEQIRDMKAIGNYFSSREEAEKAVERLRAWKRLKDKGFRFRKWDWLPDQNIICGNIGFYIRDNNVDTDDLDLFLGGEE